MTEHAQPKTTRSIIVLALRAVFAMILLTLLFQFVSFSDVATALFAARLEYIGGALILVVANLGLQVLKWRYFVRLVNPSSTNLETAASLLFGITLGTLTPGQIGEFGGRALVHNSVSAGSVLGLTLVDRLQMLCVMGIAGVTSLPFLLSLGTIDGIILVASATFVFLYLFFNPSIFPLFVARLRMKLFQRPWVQDFFSALAIFRPKDLVASLAFSLGFYSVIFFQMFLLLNAFSPVGWGDAFLGFAAMMFFKALVPISLGDLGIREASSVYFYSLRSVAHATALNASLFLFVINIFIPSILGLIFMPKLPSK